MQFTHKTRSNRKKPYGFTLIELLIVVAIIAILAAIAVPNFLEAQTRAKVSRGKADIRSMVTALETYHIDTNKYLSGQLSTDLTDSNVTGYGEPRARMTRLTTPIAYMSSLPSMGPFGTFKGGVGTTEKGYRYFGGDDWQRYTSNPANYPMWWPVSYRQVNYFWFAVGPSKVYSIVPRIAAGESPYQCPYDATNGTVSVGDIIYVSGGGSDWSSF